VYYRKQYLFDVTRIVWKAPCVYTRGQTIKQPRIAKRI